MKNFTNNFKQFTSRLSARWLIMTLMLLVGTSSAWAATITSDGSARLYFNMKAVSWWTAGTNGNGNFAYFFNNSTGKNAWSAHSVKYDGDTYYVTIPNGDWAGVILTRNNTSTAPTWNNKWNQTGDITLSSTSNYISKFSEGSASVTWGTAVKPASTASVTAASTSINVGENTTLSAALTSNTDLNTISSTSYTTTTGASIDGNTFTATTPGTYTVTATVTYYPNAYSSLTSTVETTTTITVNAATYTVKKSESGATDGTVKLGTTTLSTTAVSINSGSYDLSITAPTGYKVSAVSVDGGSLTEGATGSAEYTGKVNVSANTTVSVTYAKLTYSIGYDANGGSGAPTAQTKNYGEPLILSSTVPTRTGYTFQNWNTKSDGTGDSYDSGASYTANAAATLYAQWEANTYTITYDANGGVNPPAAQTKTYGVSLTLTTSAPTRDGYNFINWNTKADGSGTSYTKGASFTTNAATTLYAQWEEICYQTATEGTGSYSNGTITLSAKFNTCGSAFIGFQWKEEGNEWCYEDNNTNPCFIPLNSQNKENEIVTTTVTKASGKSYEFRP